MQWPPNIVTIYTNQLKNSQSLEHEESFLFIKILRFLMY